jgi:hypothetical protein
MPKRRRLEIIKEQGRITEIIHLLALEKVDTPIISI